MKSPEALLLSWIACSDVITKAAFIEACSSCLLGVHGLHFVLSSLTYLELIFVKFVGSVSSFIFLACGCPVASGCSFVAETVFLHRFALVLFSKSLVFASAWVYFQVVYSIALICLLFFSQLAHSCNYSSSAESAEAGVH